jgi:multicomponent Na+:H+ antiporter subunit C
MLEIILERFNYIPIIILMMTGLYVVIATGNLVKRLVGLSLFQTSVFLLYITMGKVFGGQPPNTLPMVM